LGIKKILRVYFDKNKQLKSQYISYKNEIIWYAYKKNVVVYANDSNKCYYIEPIPCNEEKLLSIKREQERKWNVYQSRITVSDVYKGPKYAFVKIFADSLSYMTDTSKIDPNANNITAYFLKGKRKIKLHYIEDNVLLLTNVHKYNYLVFEHQNKQIKIPTDMLLSGFLEFDLWFNKNPLAQETDIRQNPLPQLAKYRIKDDATPHHLAFVWRSNGNFTKQGTISTGIEKLDKYFLLEK
jgi:hypothetical protein